MKKMVVVCMVLVMLAGMSISAFAAPGAFASSPSKQQAPELVDSNNSTEGCTAMVIVTAYADRDQLTAEQRQTLETAYANIVGVRDLSELNVQLNAMASEVGVAVADLAVSDLCDVSIVEDNAHDTHGSIRITLRAQTLKNFVCLLHYYEGEWRIVEDAILTNEGEYLVFSEADFSPFAVVVSTTDIEPQPAPKRCYCWIFLLILLIILILILWYLSKRSKQDEEETAEAGQLENSNDAGANTDSVENSDKN